ncbi:hypothetical protein A2U01_0032239 [Trifolium medium]|uniref:Uncharacterized protein n=1 Tax=Trifolium medium TaxID=97028 RepID=A0A392PI30_9FABA|nr:hypothetical protein [Trifolium medium]
MEEGRVKQAKYIVPAFLFLFQFHHFRWNCHGHHVQRGCHNLPFKSKLRGYEVGG